LKEKLDSKVFKENTNILVENKVFKERLDQKEYKDLKGYIERLGILRLMTDN
jgi:hypothetical protein